MAIWDGLFTGHDREVYERAGLARKVGFGEKPALLIIDIMHSSLGDKPEPILESMKRFPQSCGEAGWKAIEQLSPLLSLARGEKIPVIYTDNSKQNQPFLLQKWGKLGESIPDLGSGNQGDSIAREIAPTSSDIVIFKRCPSVFFGTHLVSILVALGIDTLLVCGCTTSGCVRASVIDAASYGFIVAVIEECTFDRIEVTHKINLFDMNAKYADVISLEKATRYLMGKNRGRNIA